MKVCILGIDGYLGWSLALYLKARNHEVFGIDNFSRRLQVQDMGSDSIIPIDDFRGRSNLIPFSEGDISTDGTCKEYFREAILEGNKPDVIVNMAQMPSAPYSMIDAKHAAWTQRNNVIGNLNVLFAIRDLMPEVPMLGLGTMGEYGTPNVDIPEGEFELEYNGRKTRAQFPRQPGSFYHASKVANSINNEFACRMWGLKITDVMQGVVFGTKIPEMVGDPKLRTRFDVDHCFGTAINRFCAQTVINEPITPYGIGHQQRGFLPLEDAMRCFTIAIENPPIKGEYRVFNQFEDVYTILGLARLVRDVARETGVNPNAIIRNLTNPRKEAEEHYYSPESLKLRKLGYHPSIDMRSAISEMLLDLSRFRGNLEKVKHCLVPDIQWDGTKGKVEFE